MVIRDDDVHTQLLSPLDRIHIGDAAISSNDQIHPLLGEFLYDIRVEAVTPLDSMRDVITVGEFEGLKDEGENGC